MGFKPIIAILAILTVIAVPGAAGAGDIKIGAFYDLSGATADVGKDYALGIAEAIRYVNDEGGINGKPIKLYQYDYGYRIPEVHAKYKHFKRLGVAAVIGWHIVDTKALSAIVAEDQMPYMTAFYSADLTNPGRSPFNLYAATDDSSFGLSAATVLVAAQPRMTTVDSASAIMRINGSSLMDESPGQGASKKLYMRPPGRSNSAGGALQR